MDIIMEYFVTSIVGIALLAARLYFFTPLLKSGNNRTLEEWDSANSSLLLFFPLMTLWYIVPFALVAYAPQHHIHITVISWNIINEDHCVSLFLLLAPYKEGLIILRVYGALRTLFTCVACYTMFTVDGSQASFFCSVAVAVFLVAAMCSYRIIIMVMIIKSKSVNLTPCIVCSFMILSPAIWFLFCTILQKNVTDAVTTGSEVVLGAGQLLLFAIFRDRTH